MDTWGDEDVHNFPYLRIQDTAIANAIVRDIIIEPEFIINFE